MRRNDQPSRPKAMTCSRFSLLKTWLMTTEANFPSGGSALSLLSMAAFHLIIYGRFWVITEGEIVVSPSSRATWQVPYGVFPRWFARGKEYAPHPAAFSNSILVTRFKPFSMSELATEITNRSGVGSRAGLFCAGSPRVFENLGQYQARSPCACSLRLSASG